MRFFLLRLLNRSLHGFQTVFHKEPPYSIRKRSWKLKTPINLPPEYDEKYIKQLDEDWVLKVASANTCLKFCVSFEIVPNLKLPGATGSIVGSRMD